MARLPLHTLPTFRVVATLGNLRAAAERLHLTHSAVSQQLQLLEQQLGVPLFDRVGRRLVLNAAGQALLPAVADALDLLDQGVRRSVAAATGDLQRIRVTLLPSFAQRWVLPRISRWRARFPDIPIELHTSQHLVDLEREGYHVALRQGTGPWRGLQAERLIESPLIVVGAPAAVRRLRGAPFAALADEPLLGDGPLWQRFFALGGHQARVRPVADFNDFALMLQACEQDLGIALARELLAADALRDARLVRLAPLAMLDDDAQGYWFVHPPALADWPPLVAFRGWLHDELARSQAELDAVPIEPVLAKGTAAAGR